MRGRVFALMLVAVLKPDLVVFASRLTARFGKEAIAGPCAAGICTVTVPHPVFLVESSVDARGWRERAIPDF